MKKGDTLKIGEWVNIERTALGKTEYQRAECVAIMPPGSHPNLIRNSLPRIFRFHQMDGSPRDHESYLLARPKSPSGLIRKCYWPRVKDIIKEVLK